MPSVTNLTELNINYLTQAQYDDALENNQINPNELYLTPEVDLSDIYVNKSYSNAGLTVFGSIANNDSGIRIDSVNNTATTGVGISLTPSNLSIGNETSSGGNYTINEKIGITSAGVVTITGLTTPTNNSDAATKQYVDNSISNYLPLSGGTMTGNIIMNGIGILGKSSINSNANYLIAGLNKTDNYIYVGSRDGRTAGIPIGIYGSNIYLGTSGDLTLSGNLTVDGTTVKIGLDTSEALYTAINTAGWVSSVIVS